MIADLIKMENAIPQKQEFGSLSLKPTLHCQTLVFYHCACFFDTKEVY